MNLKEVKENLCYYNRLNPDHDISINDDDFIKSEPCYCDNCFSGNDKLALALLKTINEFKDLQNEFEDLQNEFINESGKYWSELKIERGYK